MKKTVIRIITLILAAVLVLGLFSSAFAMFANAEEMNVISPKIITADTTVSSTITTGKVRAGLTITFNFLPEKDASGNEIELKKKTYLYNEFSLPSDSSFSWSENSTLTIGKVGNENYYAATLKNIEYNGGLERELRLNINYDNINEWEFLVPISAKYFREQSSSSSEDEEDELPISDIAVESVTVLSGDGEKISEVTEDTPPFTVEIVFSDIGLMEERTSSLEDVRLHTYITSSVGLKTLGGTAGTIKLISAGSLYPRFRATFKNIQCDGTGNALEFRVQYDLEDYSKSITGKGTAILYQVTKEDEEDEKKIMPLTPKVIVRSYTYGDEPITAGDEFSLDMSFGNTGKDVAAENVDITIEPGNGFTITAASNMAYFPRLGPGENVAYSVPLRANAAVESTSTSEKTTEYSVMVKFKYQYISSDTDKEKTYTDATTEVKIAIPVTQLDRFSIDEITDYSQNINVGEEGYLTVPISNEGKSPTYNITGSVRSEGADFVAPNVRYGNLEAGKSATLDILITINTPGEFKGEAVIFYEDENMHKKELAVPFEIMVNEPFVPPPEPPPAEIETQSVAMHPLSIFFCVAGALLVAAPIALYLIKRAKAKGSGDADEDF